MQYISLSMSDRSFLQRWRNEFRLQRWQRYFLLFYQFWRFTRFTHRSPMRLFCMNILIVSSLKGRFELPFIKLFLLAKRFVKYIEQFILQFNSVLVLLLQWHIRQHNTYVLFRDETIPVKFVELVHETR
jgi:uncharacterized protein (DUF1919 family)